VYLLVPQNPYRKYHKFKVLCTIPEGPCLPLFFLTARLPIHVSRLSTSSQTFLARKRLHYRRPDPVEYLIVPSRRLGLRSCPGSIYARWTDPAFCSGSRVRFSVAHCIATVKSGPETRDVVNVPKSRIARGVCLQ
jgi:hypothetical protein